MRRRRGYLLVEMIAIIILLGATAIVVTRLTTLILRVYRDVPAAASALRSQRQWLAILRDDAWAAPRVEARDAELHLGDVTWTYAAGTLTRADGADARRWNAPRPIAWRSDGRSLVIVGDDGVAVPLATPSALPKEPS